MPDFYFNLLSDLHLELRRYPEFEFPETCNVLFLAGDCGRLSDQEFVNFIQDASDAYEHVYFILGNHEAYKSQNWDAAIRQANDIADKFDNVTFLQNKSVLITNGLRLFGATLHSHIPEDVKEAIEAQVNDFKMIGEWSVVKHNEENRKSIEWLNTEILTHQNKGERFIGLFHYPPVTKGVSNPVYELYDRPLSSAFCSDFSNEYWFNKMDTICFGHTHFNPANNHLFFRNVKILSNQRGYKDENVSGYQAHKVFTVSV